MYKNQLQELAQRSCFNLPSYTSIREGPDHAPRFKAIVNFNGETFDSPHYCSTLRQAEHAAAEVALNSLSTCGPSQSLAARILVSFFCSVRVPLCLLISWPCVRVHCSIMLNAYVWGFCVNWPYYPCSKVLLRYLHGNFGKLFIYFF